MATDQFISEAVRDLIRAWNHGRIDYVAPIVARVTDQLGAPGEYLLCVGLAQFITTVNRFEKPTQGGCWAFRITDADSDEVFEPDEVVLLDDWSAISVAGARFLVASVNEDTDMTHTLFDIHGAALVAGLLALMTMFREGRAHT